MSLNQNYFSSIILLKVNKYLKVTDSDLFNYLWLWLLRFNKLTLTLLHTELFVNVNYHGIRSKNHLLLQIGNCFPDFSFLSEFFNNICTNFKKLMKFIFFLLRKIDIMWSIHVFLLVIFAKWSEMREIFENICVRTPLSSAAPHVKLKNFRNLEVLTTNSMVFVIRPIS